ncbi:MAG: LPS translocon maturation chaperone LptM [Pseudolabrys sp.]
MSIGKGTFLRLALIGALASALGLAGCGRKGALDLPPSAAADASQATDTQVVVDPDGTKRTRKPLPIDVLLN